MIGAADEDGKKVIHTLGILHGKKGMLQHHSDQVNGAEHSMRVKVDKFMSEMISKSL